MIKEPHIATPPHLQGIPRVDFMTLDYNALVFNKGYDVQVEPGFPCPCKQRVNAYQSACVNCQGTGWVFGTPTKMKAVLTSINSSTKYKDWSAENVGTVNITVEERFRLAFMDKVTVTDSKTIDSENVLVKTYQENENTILYANTVYPMQRVVFLFKFVSPNLSLQRLEEGADYTIDGNKIRFAEGAVAVGDSLTVRYEHSLSYAVLDVNHDVRNTYYKDYDAREKQNRLPVSAVARKLHYVIDAQNFLGNNIVYNETR
jgi:hypothetical protein